MKGDFERCEIGDFISYNNGGIHKDKGYVYYILEKGKDGWVAAYEITEYLNHWVHSKHRVVATVFDIETDECTLVKKDEILDAFDNPTLIAPPAHSVCE